MAVASEVVKEEPLICPEEATEVVTETLQEEAIEEIEEIEEATMVIEICQEEAIEVIEICKEEEDLQEAINLPKA